MRAMLMALASGAIVAPVAVTLADPADVGFRPIVDERFDPAGSSPGLPDPYVFEQDGYYYIFGTGNRFVRTRTLMADDVEVFALDLDLSPESGKGGRQVWSFRPYHHSDGSYHAYATIHYGWFRTAIGHLVPQPGEMWTAERPITRWRLLNMLVGDVERRWVAYDSNVIADDDGSLYLIYNSGHPDEVLGRDIHIKVRRLLDPATLDPAFEPRPILSPEGLRSEDRNPGSIQIVEGTTVHRLGDTYVLMYSVGDFDDANYRIGAAFSDRLVPPEGGTYRKVLVPGPANLWGNTGRGNEVHYLLQSQEPQWPNYCGDRVNGPGIGSIVRMGDGQHVLVVHARHAGQTRLGGQGRYVWRVPLAVDISPDRPMSEWLVPRLAE